MTDNHGKQSPLEDDNQDRKAPLVTDRDPEDGDSALVPPDDAAAPMSSKKALWAWLILCFSVCCFNAASQPKQWITDYLLNRLDLQLA
jgi:hypothetical protein